MNGITIDINPVAFQFGTLTLRWYPIIIISAIIVAVVMALKQAEKKSVRQDDILNLLPWLIGAGIIGARLFHVIDRWEDYRDTLVHIIMVQHGGLAIWGAIIGGLVAAVIYTKAKRIPLGRLLDVLVPGLLVAQIIGRIACVINGDAYGAVTGLPWGFIYVNSSSSIPVTMAGVPTHPYPVYEMIWNGLTLLGLTKLRPYLKADGAMFLWYTIAYSAGRFLLTFVREEKIWFWGLQEAQLISIATIVVAMVVFFILARRNKAGATQMDTA